MKPSACSLLVSRKRLLTMQLKDANCRLWPLTDGQLTGLSSGSLDITSAWTALKSPYPLLLLQYLLSQELLLCRYLAMAASICSTIPAFSHYVTILWRGLDWWIDLLTTYWITTYNYKIIADFHTTNHSTLSSQSTFTTLYLVTALHNGFSMQCLQ
jgi:hypothetical protein